MKVQAGPWSFLLGMEWFIGIDRKERIRLGKTNARLGRVMVRFEGMRYMGFHTDEAHAAVYAGALLLGHHHPHCILCWPVKEELYWFCVIQGGKPLVGLDLILDEQQAVSHLAQYQALFPSYEVLSVQGLGQAQLQERPLWVQDLLALEIQGMDAKRRSAFLVQSPQLLKRRRLKIILVTLLLSSMGFLGLEMMARERHRDDQAQMRLLRERQASEFSQQVALKGSQRRQELNGLELEMIEKVRAYVLMPNPIELWQAFNDLRRAIPLSQEGLSAKGIRCGLERCEVDWALQGAWQGVRQGVWQGVWQVTEHTHALNPEPKRSDARPWPMPDAMTLVLNSRGESQSEFPIHLNRRVFERAGLQTPQQLEMYMNLQLQKRWPTLMSTPMKTISLETTTKDHNAALGSTQRHDPPVQMQSTVFSNEGVSLHPQVSVGQWQINWAGDASLVHAGEFITSLEGQPLTLESINYTYRQGLQLKGTYCVLAVSPLLWKLAQEGAGTLSDGPLGVKVNTVARENDMKKANGSVLDRTLTRPADRLAP